MLTTIGFLFNVVLIIGIVHSAYATVTVPDYIHVCHRKDPEVAKCIIQSVEVLRPRLKTGIPELNVPAIEPLNIPEIVISRGERNYRAIGKNVEIYGLSDFQVTKLKLDIPNLTFYVGVKFNRLKFTADIDVNVRILVLPIKGEGILHGNATNTIGNVILKAELRNNNGVEQMHFTSIDMDLKIDDIDVRVDNIFGGDPVVGEAVNNALSENRKSLFNAIKAVTEETASKLILQMANNICDKFSYNDVFPE